MLELFFWLTFGFLSGWAVALIAEPQAAPRRIGRSGLYGMLGAFIGGGLVRYFSGKPLIDGFDAMGIVIAIATAVVFASAFNLFVAKWHT
jgi:hypothetical protein